MIPKYQVHLECEFHLLFTDHLYLQHCAWHSEFIQDIPDEI